MCDRNVLYTKNNFDLNLFYSTVLYEIFGKICYSIENYMDISDLHLVQTKTGKFKLEYSESFGSTFRKNVKCKDPSRLYSVVFGAFGFNRGLNFQMFKSFRIDHVQGVSFKAEFSYWDESGTITLEYITTSPETRRIAWHPVGPSSISKLSNALAMETETINVSPVKHTCNGGFRCEKYYGRIKPGMKCYLGITRDDGDYYPYEDFSRDDLRFSTPDAIINNCWFVGVI